MVVDICYEHGMVDDLSAFMCSTNNPTDALEFGTTCCAKPACMHGVFRPAGQFTSAHFKALAEQVAMR